MATSGDRLERMPELIARIGSGDDDAVGEFLDLYGEFIKRQIRREMRWGRMKKLERVVGGSDIFQSVFAAFVRAVRDGKVHAQTDCQAVQYVLSCARNRVLYYIRRYSAACRDVRRVVDEPVESLAARLATSNTEESPIDSERMDEVLKRLPPRDKHLLHEWLSGYPFEALAALFDTTPAGIRGRVRRILKRLVRSLERAEQWECGGTEAAAF